MSNRSSEAEAALAAEDALRRFAATFRLSLAALADQGIFPSYAIEGVGKAPFDGRPKVIRIEAIGHYGNRFYQLLNAVMIARRVGATAIHIAGEARLDGLPRVIRGVSFSRAENAAIQGSTLTGVFFTYRGFEPLIEPLDASFIQETIEHWVTPFFDAAFEGLGDHVIALHFRGGDVFGAPLEGAALPAHYVMPPASFYIGAVEYARKFLGVHAARLIYQDRTNPAVAVVEQYLARHGIHFRSQSGSLVEDSSCLRAATHLVIPYGTFGEANALLSTRLRTLFSFREIESHEWLYHRPHSLMSKVLRRARQVRTFVTIDLDGGYIAPFEWRGTHAQRAQIRDYPGESLLICEQLT